MNDELTPEQETRINVMRGGGDAIHEALLAALGVDYNIIILVSPKNKEAVTIAARAETFNEVSSMLALANKTAETRKPDSETLQ